MLPPDVAIDPLHDPVVARQRRRSAARLGVMAGAASVAVYAIFAGTPAGRQIDSELLRRDLDGSWEWAARLPAAASRPSMIAIAVLVLCAVALLDRRPADGLRAAVLVGAAPVLSLGGEEALETFDPLGVEAARHLGPGWYPSGHAAAAMALALAALIVAPAAARGRVLLLAAGVWPAVAGWAILADAGHHVSDVAGGLLLATAIGSALVLRRRGDTGAVRRLPWPAIAVAIGVLALVSGVLAAVDDLRRPHSVLQPALILGGTVIGVLALLLAQAFDDALATEPRSRRR